MVEQVALNTNIGLNNTFNNSGFVSNMNTSPKPNSLFDLKNSVSVNDYENDFMMSGLFGSTGNMNANTPSQVMPKTTAQVAEPQATLPLDGNNIPKPVAFQGTEQDTNATVQPKVDNAVPKSSNIAKTAGGILGFLAPIAGCAVDLFKGIPFSRAFNLKQLAVTCPLVALAGFGIGAFVDGFLNTKQAQKNVQTQAA